MKYNGFELTELSTEQWDGKTRRMLVWDDEGKGPTQATIIGYVQGEYHAAWMTIMGNRWSHCSEIPKEEHVETTPFEDVLLARIKVLKAENEALKKENERLGLEVRSCHKYDELVLGKKPENKTTRRMTHRELAIWCKGNGEWTNAGMRTAYQHYEYDIDKESEMVSEHIKIRACDETEWHEPMIDETSY